MQRRSIKRIGLWLFGGSLLLILGLLILPTVLGTKWIYQPLVERLAADDFAVSVEGVRLRWFSPLKFERIEVKQLDGTPLLTIAEIRSDRGLFGYLIGGRRVGRIEILRPMIDVKMLEDSSNLQRFVKAIEGKTKTDAAGETRSRGKLQVDVEVAIFEASAKVERGDQQLVVVPPFDLNVQYLAADGPSRLKIAPAQVLKRVELTPELIDLGLGHAVPLLAQSAWFDGQISLDVGAIEVPLDQPLESRGEAVVTLHTVRSGPNQQEIKSILDFIARLRGREAQHEFVFVDGSAVAIQLQDQRVHHSGLQIGLPKIDPRLQLESSGFVGLSDKRLALNLAVPIPVTHLARREKLKELGVPKINVPIGGTLDHPVVDWSVMRGDSAELLGLIRAQLEDDAPGTAAVLGALEGAASGDADQAIAAATDLIKELRERRRRAKEADAPPATGPASTEPDEAGPNSAGAPPKTVRDRIRDLLRGDNELP